MTLPNPTQAADDAREHAIRSWSLFTNTQKLAATLTAWQTTTTPDGSPMLSVQVAGPQAAHALTRFAADYYLALPHPGDLRPQFDTLMPDRKTLVWRYCGVWVELWHPDTSPAAPKPKRPATPPAGVAAPSRSGPLASALRGLGDRLPHTRNRRTKETSRA